MAECTSAAATSPRIRSPRDSWRTGVSSSPASPSSVDQLVGPPAEPRTGQPVNRGEDPEGVAQRQVPPQLAALTEDHSEVAGQPRGGCGTGSSPQVRTCPAVGTRMPVSILIVVDLPAPFAPM